MTATLSLFDPKPEPLAENPFGELIYAYTRAQALEDGQQVAVPAEASKQAGFKWPVYMTRGVWDAYVEVPAKVTCQDVRGRLWDILWMASRAAQAGQEKFQVWVRNDNRQPRPRALYIQGGPVDMDDPSPCITIMLPEDL